MYVNSDETVIYNDDRSSEELTAYLRKVELANPNPLKKTSVLEREYLKKVREVGVCELNNNCTQIFWKWNRLEVATKEPREK
jgi:hypothetical protein